MTAFSQSLLQQADGNGIPLSGWSVQFFTSGTNTRVLVWKDAACTAPHAYPVQADGQGRLPAVYFKSDSGSLRADITFPDGRVKSIDGILPTASPDGVTAVLDPRLPNVSHTANTVVLTVADVGKVHSITSALGSATAVLLPKAAALANGQLIGVENSGAGVGIVRTQGVDLVNGRKSFLLDPGQTALVLCTQAGFEVLSRTPPAASRYVVLSRIIATPPVGPAAGAAYLAPVGSTDIWAPNAIYTADGAGGWLRHDPVIGDEATISGESTTVGSGLTIPVRVFYTGTDWINEADFIVQSRFVVQSATVSVPPTGSPIGTQYLAPAGSTGVWTANSVYTSDGAGGWKRHQPVLGDEVTVRDATETLGNGVVAPVRMLYAGSSWVKQSALSGKVASLHVRGEYASGTSSASAYTLGAGAPTVGVYTPTQLNTTVNNTIIGASITNNVLTLPVGNYRVKGRQVFHGAIAARLKFVSTTTVTALKSMPLLIPASTSDIIDFEDRIAVTATTESFQLMFILSGTSTALTLGEAAAIAGEPEVYSELMIEAL